MKIYEEEHKEERKLYKQKWFQENKELIMVKRELKRNGRKDTIIFNFY